MTIGRPTQPNELKRLKGTLRADRLPSGNLTQLSNASQDPDSIEELGENGKAFWQVAWSTPWLSHKTDYWLVYLTAQALDEREQVREALAEDPNDRKLRTTLRELDKQVISSYSLMGFTPSDRSRLGVAEVKKESKFEELMAKRIRHRELLDKARDESLTSDQIEGLKVEANRVYDE
jgi:hypothetical protein